jgi:hypothetical protein
MTRQSMMKCSEWHPYSLNRLRGLMDARVRPAHDAQYVAAIEARL